MANLENEIIAYNNGYRDGSRDHIVEEKMYTRKEVGRLSYEAFEVGRNFQLTGENNFKEWFEQNVK